VRNTRLPAEFGDLTRFVKEWALETERDRYVKLLATSLDELKVFFDAMLPRAEAIVAYLGRWPLDALPADARLLYDLILTFVETAHPIELKWRTTNVADSLPPERLRFHGASAEPR
jgi:hypothetical protein